MRKFTKPQIDLNMSQGEMAAQAAFIALPRPLDLEIGCGVGFHPLRRSLALPDRGLVAIEHTRDKFKRFWGRYLSHKEPKNLLPVHRNAISWMSQMQLRGQVENVFLYYPNPNPKRQNQRWFCMPFFEVIKNSLKPGGLIHLATNIESYALEAKDQAQKVWGLKIQEFSVYKGEPRTHFEKKYLERGDACYQLIVRKADYEN